MEPKLSYEKDVRNDDLGYQNATKTKTNFDMGTTRR
mgnify:FL=1